MTRPMPGPPECECPEVPKQFWTTYAGAVDPNTMFEYTPECPLHGEVSSPKRLTDAECAAEYWRAASDFRDRLRHGLAGDDLNPEWGRRLIWHRFATRPHALEEA